MSPPPPMAPLAGGPPFAVFADAEELAAGVATAFGHRLHHLQQAGTTPRVALTGGRIATRAYELIDGEGVDWQNVEFWWGDERFVPEGHNDRNDQQAKDTFLDRFEVPADHIHSMPAHGCDLSMAEAADQYAATLPESFDLVLLGLGPDGHIASLFPGFEPTDRLAVEVFNSPKPPPQRISLTIPALSNTAAVWFVVAGEDKAAAVAKSQQAGAVDEFPARGVQGRDETAWWLDEAAAGVEG